MRVISKPELKGIFAMLLIALVVGVLLAGMSGKLEQWGVPWFTGSELRDKIVFVSDRSGTKELYVMNLDGSSQKQLTDGAKVLSAPAVSKTGNKIAFIGMLGESSQVMVVGAKGGNPEPLTASTGPKRQPYYSPDGKKLSYIDAGRVYIAELNGSNPDPILPNHEELVGAMGDPMGRGAIPRYSAYAWGPEGQSLAGVSSPDRLSDGLTYLPLEEGKLRKLLPASGGAKVVGLSFATDKALMVASVETSKQSLLLAYDPQMKQPSPVLSLREEKLGNPAVSPDGSLIVVPVSSPNDKPGPGLLKVDLQSGSAGMLANGEFEDLVFSQDGTTVLASMRDKKSGKRSIVTIDPASGKVTRLTRDGDCFGAVYSPTSEK